MAIPHANNLSGFDYRDRSKRSERRRSRAAMLARIAVARANRSASKADSSEGSVRPWPALARIVCVVGLSAALWAGLIAMAAFLMRHI